jgi:hypothetical protein
MRVVTNLGPFARNVKPPSCLSQSMAVIVPCRRRSTVRCVTSGRP